MRCSEFLDQHCLFVDDTLAGVELVRMHQHMTECPSCAALDQRVRRSLMLARSLAEIEPSPDFSRRLEARLRAAREGDHQSWACANFRTIGVVGAVASLLMVAYIAQTLHEQSGKMQDVVLPPVVAMAEPPQPEIVDGDGQGAAATSARLTAPAVIASVSAGMPLWPAAMLAEQVSIHAASYQASYHRTTH